MQLQQRNAIHVRLCTQIAPIAILLEIAWNIRHAIQIILERLTNYPVFLIVDLIQHVYFLLFLFLN